MPLEEMSAAAVMTILLIAFSAMMQYQQYKIKNDALNYANAIIMNTYMSEIIALNLSIDSINTISPIVNTSNTCPITQICRLAYINGKMVYLRWI
ncbi:MAG: hypothetical protein QXY10_00670 [Candidatus Micrarchaeaceae archaeon]